MIKLIISIVSSVKLNIDGFNGSAVIPSSLYPCNLLTPKWQPYYKSFFDIENPIRINRWTTHSSQIKEAFSYWIKHSPSLFTYEYNKELIGTTKYPRWVFDHSNTIKGINEQLIEDVKYLNSLEKSQLRYQEQLPDSVSRINKLDPNLGVDVNLQINNILYWRYHRYNGDQMFRMYVEKGSKSFELGDKKVELNGKKSSNPNTKGRLRRTHFVYSTESSIAHMNLFTNLHIQSLFQNDMNNVIAIVSPTIDSSSFKELIRIAISTICTTLFPSALSLGLPIMLFLLVLEKEENIKNLLQVNGLVEFNYWVGFLTWNMFILTATTLVFMYVGWVYINIAFFRQSNLLITFWFLSAWNFSQIGFALFISSFVKKSTSATLIGYSLSIFLIFFLSSNSQFLFPNPAHLPWFFYLIPQSAFVRYFYISISRCIEMRCLNSLIDLYEGEIFWVFLMIHLTGAMYFFGGLILNEPKWKKFIWNKIRFIDFRKRDNLSKRNKGSKLFDTEISVSEAELSKIQSDRLDSNSFQSQKSTDLEDFDEEQIAKYSMVHKSAVKYTKEVNQLKDLDFEDYVLVAQNLSKKYECTQGIKKALNNFSIKLSKDKIFGLLGPNGAGKTTFLSIVTGINTYDNGFGWICGRNINDRTQNLGNIGFCPQFDILWPNMNVLEHLIFMGMFKGQTKTQSKINAKTLIEQVDLERDWKKNARQLSGGMKRRLSLSMALTGKPKIIFLDEPSSGLDPVKRRHFWSLIKRVTSRKAVLLTTHLMEEADTLCNEIGIICTGKLRCYGNSLSLKSEFTQGVKLQIVLRNKHPTENNFKEFISSLTDQGLYLHMESKFKSTLNIVIDDKSTKMSTIFEVMTNEEIRKKVEDWSISLGSLEDVFLNVVKKYRESNIEVLE